MLKNLKKWTMHGGVNLMSLLLWMKKFIDESQFGDNLIIFQTEPWEILSLKLAEEGNDAGYWIAVMLGSLFHKE